MIHTMYMQKKGNKCGDCWSLLSEEFSRVQDESVDKVCEMSNQSEKNGKAEIHKHICTLFCFTVPS